MRDPRLGATFRHLRIRRGWRQKDVATRAGISKTTVGLIEAGSTGGMSLDTLERLAAVLEVRLQLRALWRGGDLKRQLSARHSALQELVARYLAAAPGWVLLPEVSFAFYADRGVIDILAWHAATKSLLVIEIKTEIVDVGETLATLDRKRRLAARIASERGWHANSVSAWLVVAESTMNRRRVAEHVTLLRTAYPLDGWAMRRWVRVPTSSAVAGLSFWANSAGDGLRQGLAARKRVRLSSGPDLHARKGSDRAVGRPVGGSVPT